MKRWDITRRLVLEDNGAFSKIGDIPAASPVMRDTIARGAALGYDSTFLFFEVVGGSKLLSRAEGVCWLGVHCRYQ